MMIAIFQRFFLTKKKPKKPNAPEFVELFKKSMQPSRGPGLSEVTISRQHLEKAMEKGPPQFHPRNPLPGEEDRSWAEWANGPVDTAATTTTFSSSSPAAAAA